MGECLIETDFANGNPDFTIPLQQPGRSQEPPGCCDCSSNRTVRPWRIRVASPQREATLPDPPEADGTALRCLSN